MKRSSIAVTICVLTLTAMASGQAVHLWVGMGFPNPTDWYNSGNWVPPAVGFPTEDRYDFGGFAVASSLVEVESGGEINVMTSGIVRFSGLQVKDGRMGVAGHVLVTGLVEIGSMTGSGLLGVSGEFKANGTIVVMPGGVVDVSGGTLDADTIDNSYGGTVNLTGSTIIADTFILDGTSTFNWTGGQFQVPNMLVRGGSYNRPGQMVELSGTETMSLQGGTMTVGTVELISDIDDYEAFTWTDGDLNFDTITVRRGVFNGAGRSLTVEAGDAVSVHGGTMTVQSIDNSAGGAFTFDGGTMNLKQFTGTLAVTGGNLSPGASPGLLTVTGDYSASAASTLTIEISGPARGADPGYDAMDVSGTASLDGTLSVQLLNGYAPADGAQFHILQADTICGNFSTVSLPSLTGYAFSYAHDGTDAYVYASYTRDFDFFGYDSSAAGGAAVLFDTVTAPGSMTALRQGDAGFPDADLTAIAAANVILATAGGTPIYYDFECDALTFSGEYEIIFRYDESVLGALGIDEAKLKVWHYDGATLADITTVLDMDNNIIIGRASSFSGIGVGAVPEPASAGLLVVGAVTLLFRRR